MNTKQQCLDFKRNAAQEGKSGCDYSAAAAAAVVPVASTPLLGLIDNEYKKEIDRRSNIHIWMTQR